MLRIRLVRKGSKKRPYYRVVVSDPGSGGGNIVEVLGSHDPRRSEQETIDRERAAYWIGRGAHATDSVRTIIERKPV